MVTASGHPTLADACQVQDLSMVAALALVAGWPTPPGALTVLFTLNGRLMVGFADRYVLLIPVVVAGSWPVC
jgi:hypothetical protein